MESKLVNHELALKLAKRYNNTAYQQNKETYETVCLAYLAQQEEMKALKDIAENTSDAIRLMAPIERKMLGERTEERIGKIEKLIGIWRRLK